VDGQDRSWSQQLFQGFADEAVRKLPLYRRLCEGAAGDREVADRLLVARTGQQIPNLLLAAVHDVLLTGEPSPLADWYGSIAPHPRPVGLGEDDPWTLFRDLALHHPGVDERLRTRATQTNEVGRCAALLPALAGVAASAPGARPHEARPLGLVEVGASAGLNLLVDRYGYRYGPDGPEINPSSPLTLHSTFRGNRRPSLPIEVPHVESRVGLDLHPVDVSDPAQARWLVACQWPDQPDRIHRARTAIALAHTEKPELVTGDAVADVGDLVVRVAQFALPVVVSTWVLSYLDDVGRQALMVELDHLAAIRDLTLLFAEQPILVTGLPIPPRPDGRPDGPETALVRVDWRSGARTERRLADMHPHGTWIEWLD